MASDPEHNVLLVGDFITDRTWLVGEPSLLERYNSHYSVHPHTLVEPGRETDVAGGIATVARAIGSIVPSNLTVIGAWSYYAQKEFELNRLVPLEGELKTNSIEFHRIYELEFTSVKTRVYLPEPGGARLKYRFDRNSRVTTSNKKEEVTHWPDQKDVDLVILGDYGYGVLNLPEVQKKVRGYAGRKKPTIILRSSSRELIEHQLEWDVLMLNLHHLAHYIDPDRNEPFDTPVTKQVGDECTYHPSLIAALGKVSQRLEKKTTPWALLLNLESEGALLLHNGEVNPFLLAAPQNDAVTGVGANDVLLAHFGVTMMTSPKADFGEKLRDSCYRAARASAAFISSALQLELKDNQDKLWYAPKVEVTQDKIDRSTPILNRPRITLEHLNGAVDHAQRPFQAGVKRIKLRDAGWYLDGFHTVNPHFGGEIVRLKNRIKDYVAEGTPPRPFFAVLCGEPGAGKSSLAKALGHYSRCEVIPANAAQWTSTDDLFDLCERIRDVRMAGKTPLAFIDEVDSPTHDRDLFAKLLSPVWDGTYSADGRIRALGTPTVFVIAGSGAEWRRGKDLFHAAENPHPDDARPPKLGDLVSRLSARPLDIRPLAERSEDIAYIVAHQVLKRFPRVNAAARGIFDLFSDCKYGARSIASVIENFGPPKNERVLDTTDLRGITDTLSMHLRTYPPEWKDSREPVMIMP